MSHRSRGLLLGCVMLVAIAGVSLGAVGTVSAQQVDVDASDLEGTGTQTDPYILTNASELQAIETDRDAYYKLGADIDARETAGWNGNAGFDPIGEGAFSDDFAFTGSFNGAGHTIRGLTINRPSEYDVGLFGRTGTNGSIKDVTLNDTQIVGNRTVGGLVGENNGVITDTQVTGSVIATDSTAGGVVGENRGSVHNATTHGVLTADSNVGGLAGSNVGDISESSAATNATGNTDVGGLIGFNTGYVTNSTVSGNVSGTERIGGLIGINKGTIINSESHGSVNGSFEVGGLTGQDTGTINGSTATGSVTATQRAGGLVGNNLRGNVTASTATGVVSVSGSGAGGLIGRNGEATIADSYATGTVNADNTIGGLVGSNADVGTIRRSYATGNVNGSDSVGGFVGTNVGVITDSYATGAATGTDGVGGFVATNFDTVNRSYARGVVSGSTNVGGFNGNGGGTIEASYWDTETSGQLTSPHATGLTTDEMTGVTATGNLVGFDFTRTWNSTTGYPILQSIDGASQQPPVAAFDYTPEEPHAGEQVTFTDRSSTTGGTIQSWSWSFGDGNSSNRSTPTHRFDAGTYTVILTVIDDAGRTNQVRKQIYIAPDMPGNGTLEDPYIVTTVTELQTLNANRSAHYRLGGDIDASETASWNNNSGFKPIGSTQDGRLFTGSLDGAGYTVANLTINRSTKNNVGVFGVVGTGGVVENITFETQAISGTEFVGGVIGYNRGGTVTDVTTTGTVTGTNFTGGLVGYNSDTAGSEIIRSSTTATVTGSNNVGGLAGTNNGVISESYAAGSVTGETYVGGLLGSNVESVRDSYATSTVTGLKSVGGLVGENGATVTDSYAAGLVDGSNATGGLVGSTTIAGSTVVDSYWDTETTMQSESVGGTGLTTANMTGRIAFETMSGLEEVWVLSDGYPSLRVHSAVDSQPPSVDFEQTPKTPVVGETVTFEDLSSDSDGTVDARSWSFGDGTQSTNATPTHVYGGVNTYTVTLRVIDDDGISNVTTKTVSVERDLQGNGTRSDPYVLTTTAELQSIEEDLTAHYRLGTNINASETKEWNRGEGFDPLGDDPTTAGSEAFSGSFDGAGHTIRGLTINRSSEDRVGLFGGLSEGGLIRNVTITDSNISGAAQVGGVVGENRGTVRESSAIVTLAGSTKVGGLVGENRGDIWNTSTAGTVTGSDERVGGLIGFNYNATVSDSYQTVVNGSSSEATVSGHTNVGGLIGYSSNSLVTNSSATGAVEGTGFDPETLGGLIGTNVGLVTNSSATGSVSGFGRMGGLVGNNLGTVDRSFATGDLSGEWGIGGLAGTNRGGSVARSYATGTVTGSTDTGGLIGVENGDVTASYWDIETTGQSTSGGGTGLTTAQMTGEAAVTNMTDFDFTTTWKTTESYPVLAWQTNGHVSIFDAIDTNNDSKIGDFEILQAIEYWRTGQAVPGTDSQTISDMEILTLIEHWRDNATIDET